MPTFFIEGKGKDTGRKRTRTRETTDEEHARALGEEEGIIVEKITRLPDQPPDPPTDRQLAYAKHLGIPIPANATKQDVSTLIDRAVNDDPPATTADIQLAKSLGVPVHPYIGQTALYDRLAEALGSENLASLFIFRVYQDLAGKNASGVSGPTDPVIKGLAADLLKDKSAIKSIRRYYGSDHLRQFGEWTSSDGRAHESSRRTVAYQAAAALVREQFRILELQHQSRRRGHNRGSKHKRRREAAPPWLWLSPSVLAC
jgi:hypothetical protein